MSNVVEGSRVWLPCEVGPGPFVDECRVLIVDEEGSEWIGFVNVRWLQCPDAIQGQNAVLASVANVDGGKFQARIPGTALRSQLLKASTDRVARIDSVQT